jgi:hypothetical protein
MTVLMKQPVALRAGDLVLARIDRVGQHKHLQLTDGRKARLYPGDEVLIVLGDRYAPDQFEGIVPKGLGACHLIAGGGVAAETLCRSSAVNSPTSIETLGLIGNGDGKPINLDQYRLPRMTTLGPLPPVVAVTGTSMNAGKTETLCQLVKGLTRAGLRVGVGKVTGTGSGGDLWAVTDAGAESVLDFTDAGLASTYRVSAERVAEAAITILGHLAEKRPDVICLEVADGLYQTETARLMTTPHFTRLLDGILFAAGDAMGAIAGIGWLRGHGLPVLGITGKLTCSPLAMREAEVICDLPVIPTFALNEPHQAYTLIERWIDAGPLSAVAK